MNIHIHVTGEIRLVHEPAPGASPAATVDDLEALGEMLMSAFTDKIAAIGGPLEAAIDAASARSSADVAALKAQVDALTATVQAGGATPEDLKALDDLQARLQAKIDAIDPTNPATTPPDQGTPTPAPAP